MCGERSVSLLNNYINWFMKSIILFGQKGSRRYTPCCFRPAEMQTETSMQELYKLVYYSNLLLPPTQLSPHSILKIIAHIMNV
jgi:hypothetical protein